jgi:hypothetical protein
MPGAILGTVGGTISDMVSSNQCYAYMERRPYRPGVCRAGCRPATVNRVIIGGWQLSKRRECEELNGIHE